MANLPWVDSANASGLHTDVATLADYDPLQVSDLKQTPEAVRNQMRAMALADTYYLAKVVLGYDQLTPHTHGPLCTFLDTCKTRRRLIQMPRSHFKTTLVTVSKRIQDALNNPGVRILIVGDSAENAEKHLGKIRRQFETNALLRWLFPDIIWEEPSTQAPLWARTNLMLKTTALHGEPTFDAIGAGGGVVSRHYDIINPDDIISDDELFSETEMAKVIEWASGLESLFAMPIREKQMDIPSTFWRTDDVYAFLEDYYGNKVEPIPTGPYSYLRGNIAVFRRAAIENGAPIFPEAITMEYLNRLREINPERYAAQYANNPRSSDVAYFQPQYLRYYKWAIVDHALRVERKNGEIEVVKISDLVLQSFCDPHAGGSKRVSIFGGGRAAVLTTGVHQKTGRVFILDSWIKRSPTDRIITEIIRQNEKWLPETFSIEANGLQKMIKPWLDERVERENRLPIPYRPFIPKGDKDGERRIKGLQPLFRAGQIYLQEGFSEFIEEYLAWPRGSKDGLDALSQGLQQWGIGFDDLRDEELAAYEQRLRAMRSTATGY